MCGFRKEKNYLLICNCKTCKTFILNKKYYIFLKKLKEGMEKLEIKNRQDLDKLLKDLIKLNWLYIE